MKKILILALTLCTVNAFSQRDYKDFPPQGGYNVGSFILISKKKLSAPIITKERMEKYLPQSIGAIVKIGDIPPMTVDKTKLFKASVKAENSLNTETPNIHAQLRKVKHVTQNLRKGERFGFSGGTSAYSFDVLKCLPKSELEIINSAITNNKNIYYISEVIQYSDGETVLEWDKKNDFEITAKLKDFLGVSGNQISWDSGKLVIKYDKPVFTSFKYEKIDDSFKKRIKDEINSRNDNQSPCINKLTGFRVVINTSNDDNEGGNVIIGLVQNGKTIWSLGLGNKNYGKKNQDIINGEINNIPLDGQELKAVLVLENSIDKKVYNISWRGNIEFVFYTSLGIIIRKSGDFFLDTSGKGLGAHEVQDF